MTERLAVIVPAFKQKFFDSALSCLANQTNKNFSVYVGDDCSPENLLEIVDRYRGRLDIIYHRFESNMGAKNLVDQWRRCVSLSKDEEWICLFSDDDILDVNCIEQFYVQRSIKGNYDVYRFNTITIDSDDQILSRNPVGPAEETSAEMAYNLLLGKRGNVIGDHIFSRKVYEANKTFVYTDYAQGADWATSILFSKEKGICLIPNANFYWRYSGINISSTASRLRNHTMNGHLQFIEWVMNHFKYLENTQSLVTYEMIRTAARKNLRNVINYHYKGYNLSFLSKLVCFYNTVLKLNIYSSVKEAVKIKIETSSRLKKLQSKFFTDKKI